MLAVLLGGLLVCRFTDLPSIEPLSARLFLVFGAGAACGIGLASSLFFVFGILLGAPWSAMAIELAGLAWAGYEAYRRRDIVFRPAAKTGLPLFSLVAIGSLLLAAGLGAGTAWTAWEINPHGNWDAWAIWNLRAKFLAAGPGLASRAWSPALSATHPEYPLLLSSFVAHCWNFSHSVTTAVPAATSLVFFLALIALAAGGVTLLRGPTLGFLIALMLATTPRLLHELPAQYADVPLACYFAGAIVFMMLDRPILAGVFAGFAAWTKDEGSLFLVLFLAAILVFKRRAVLRAAAGALPALALTVLLKAVLARGNASLLFASLPGAAHRIADWGRYATVGTAFGHGFIGMTLGWYHPIFPLIVLAAALRFDRERRREMVFCATILATLLIGYFFVYILTTNDLNWQLQTSLSRLFVQVWPVLLLAGFVGLRAPEAAVAASPVLPAKAPTRTSGKRRRFRAA